MIAGQKQDRKFRSVVELLPVGLPAERGDMGSHLAGVVRKACLARGLIGRFHRQQIAVERLAGAQDFSAPGRRGAPQVVIAERLVQCVPKIRFCNIGGEGHRELGVT